MPKFNKLLEVSGALAALLLFSASKKSTGMRLCRKLTIHTQGEVALGKPQLSEKLLYLLHWSLVSCWIKFVELIQFSAP